MKKLCAIVGSIVVGSGVLLMCGPVAANGGHGGGHGGGMGGGRGGAWGGYGGGWGGHTGAWGGWHGRGGGGSGWYGHGWYGGGYWPCCGWGMGFYDPLWDPLWYDYGPDDSSYADIAPPVGQGLPPAPTAWYYCPSSRSYYPNVRECASAWQTVPVAPGS